MKAKNNFKKFEKVKKKIIFKLYNSEVI